MHQMEEKMHINTLPPPLFVGDSHELFGGRPTRGPDGNQTSAWYYPPVVCLFVVLLLWLLMSAVWDQCKASDWNAPCCGSTATFSAAIRPCPTR